MAKYILRNILLLVAISLQLNLSAQNKATGLQTDLINDAGTLYQNGYRSDKTMAELNDSEFSQYQYAAIRSSRPTFSWIVPQDKGQHNVIQRSYQIAVDDNPADAAPAGKVWNSGRQKSTQSIAVAYGGADLQPNKTYYWSVKVTTNSSRGDWSKTESFRTASNLKPYSASFRPQIRQKELPTVIQKTYPQTTFIDFGRASFCSLELTLESPRDNDTIYVAIGEDCKDGRVNSHPHGTVRYYRYALPLRKGRHTYPIIPAHDKRNTGPQAVLMPEYIGEVAPMRYCQIDGYTGTLSQQDIVRHTAIYPFNYAAAHFHSDNEILNSVWELCKYTIKATSAGISPCSAAEHIASKLEPEPLANTAILCFITLFYLIYLIVTPSPSTMRPITDAFSPCFVRISIALSASLSSSAITIPIPILKMLNISR